MAEGEVRLHAGVALAPEDPHDRFGDAEKEGQRVGEAGHREHLRNQAYRQRCKAGERRRGHVEPTVGREVPLAPQRERDEQQRDHGGAQVHQPGDGDALVQQFGLREHVRDEP